MMVKIIRNGSGSAVSATVALLVLSLLFVNLSAGVAAASGAGQVSNYALGCCSPSQIAAGPDGALWFTTSGDSLGRITTSGSVSYHYLGDTAAGITVGPDGNLWLTTYGGNVGWFNTSSYTFNPVTSIPNPRAITTGPDGNLWVTASSGDVFSIDKITTSGTVTTYSNTGIYYPDGIAAGPDGNVWFTNGGNNTIGRITTSGVVRDFTGAGVSGPYGITAGPYGGLWFTNYGNNSIGHITTTGKVSNYTGTGISAPTGITVGPDKALWFTNFGSSTIGRITTKGTVSNYTGAGIDQPQGIASGASDGAIWFANPTGNSIGRITTNVTPAISGFAPAYGPPGTKVTIKGQNLAGATNVAFNGTAASIIYDGADRIVTRVPANATPGPITVTTRAGTATSAQAFT